ncbi:MAG: LysR substrate-binding domain-containing protein [Alphaproteobacteria bacterium]|jgi:LysR family transcriptional regulator, glycine cleavage system transcriptional activator|nr:LysR family transcriptional regulator [Rhodospirillaceae bacterium]MBT6204234.1 LysR family transcriptional regulator [Rhodospirillaceae bacterium]MBT7647348.1 LysR family transcriptional regulator [Rhodospirillaceae bacterium]MDG2479885.1 LysR substrate-binding domain-containing protein [Alphaproteobacteria bacterium]
MARKLPPLKALRAFEAAARHQSFSKAAEELHVTHAAISQQIRGLESWLGAKLFRRITRGVELLEDGERYRAFLTEFFDRLERETGELRVRLGAAHVTVRVDPQFAALWLVPRVSEFSQRYPEIELNIVTEAGAFEARRDDADLAIVYDYTSQHEHDASLSCELLIVVDAYPVCSVSHAPDVGRDDPADLLSENLLHDEDRQWWRQWFQASGVETPDPIPGPLYSQSHMALMATESGQGVALLDDLETAESVYAGRLVRLSEHGIPAGAYFLLSRRDGALKEPVVAARTWILDKMVGFREKHGLSQL